MVAAIIGLALPHSLAPITRTILALDVGSVLFIGLTLVTAYHATPQLMRHAALIHDEGLFTIFATTILGALFSIAVIVLELNGAKGLPHQAEVLHIALGMVSMALVWSLIHMLFALHYAHIYYDPPEPGADGAAPPPQAIIGGLDIPGCAEPDYWDFCYFAFVIGMTCQTSDVNVTSREMRRLALGHGMLSFLFNTVILALAINVAASLL